MNNNNFLETDRLYINKINLLNDIPHVRHYYNDKETMCWIPNRKDYYTSEYLSMKFESNNKLYKNGIGIYKITHKADNKIIGEIGLYDCDKTDNAIEIGYIILSTYWRRGLATELLIKVEDYIQHILKKKLIIAHLIKGNKCFDPYKPRVFLNF
ncbi:GNAT family N-acetyltransferase [Myroides albus]|uniref:GNAT family N-acetyltransferase n=1 Tax=Myroides albus TaxID=2562892 RepID=UPI0021597962|nr:GNAT family N-acetyltransferase [Myroides albus]UVD78566.1 GNAT family N-acetyltransferase [Myroides albus]